MCSGRLFIPIVHARLKPHKVPISASIDLLAGGAALTAKEDRLVRLRRWYHTWSSVMVLSLALLIVGIPLTFWQRSVGTGCIAYGGLALILFSSFYFIVRIRYSKAKLAHDARAHALRHMRE